MKRLPIVLLLLWPRPTPAQPPPGAPIGHGDERFKVDLLLVVAHPDDDTLVASYLAKAIHDEGKRVAVVYGTRGDSGGNAVGNEQAAALGAVREIEARRALATLGIENVWFLAGRDTASQDVLQSLEHWGHGDALERTVRLVRLTRPDVILTWLPRVVAGENHGDHQAAAVVATEAFDLAGDPVAFPEQVAAPRNRTGTGNLTEGLEPWQPKKLYYFSDAYETRLLEGGGPHYSLREVSPSRKVPYGVLALQEASPYRTQFDEPEIRAALTRGEFQGLLDRLTSGDDPWLPEPLRFLLGKTLVGGAATGDVFERAFTRPLPDSARLRPGPATPLGLNVELGGSWAFYREFWRAHGLEHLERLAPPELALPPGGRLRLPLLIRNGTGESQEVTVKPAPGLPTGWQERSGSGRYVVPAHGTLTVQVILATTNTPSKEWHPIGYAAESNGKAIGSVALRVQLRPGGLPQ